MADEHFEEFGIFAERFMHFMNLWTIYGDMLSGKYVPSLSEGKYTPKITQMLMVYGYFYSLVEDSEEGVNGFRIWRDQFPDEAPAIRTVEAQVAPFLGRLRLFRNRLGFHGSRTRAHESRAYDLFTEHSGTEIWNAISNFKSLGAALFAKANERQGIGAFNQAEVREWIDRVLVRSRDQLASVKQA
jgi:hypothetical protein